MSQYCNPLPISLLTLSVCWFVSLRPSLLPYLVIDGLADCLSGIIMMMVIILLRVMISLCCVSSIKCNNSLSFFLLRSATTMSRPAGGSANDVTRFLATGAGPGSPTSKFSASSQADWAAKRLVWVPSEKHGFEVRLILRVLVN